MIGSGTGGNVVFSHFEGRDKNIIVYRRIENEIGVGEEMREVCKPIHHSGVEGTYFNLEEFEIIFDPDTILFCTKDGVVKRIANFNTVPELRAAIIKAFPN